MKMKSALFLGLTVITSPALAQDYEIPRTEWGVPDFQAVWKHSSIIPFERPRELGEKRFYTEEEALAIEQAEQQRFDEDNEPLDPDRPPPEVASSLPPIGNYDLFWREDAQFIPTINGEMRREELQSINSVSAGRLTSLDLEEGDTVDASTKLFALDGRPSVAVNGDFSFYRELNVGAQGPDVEQLESILESAGYEVGVVDQFYTEETRDGLAQWQDDFGFKGGITEVDELVNKLKNYVK